jgi:hypothetical protein
MSQSRRPTSVVARFLLPADAAAYVKAAENMAASFEDGEKAMRNQRSARDAHAKNMICSLRSDEAASKRHAIE